MNDPFRHPARKDVFYLRFTKILTDIAMFLLANKFDQETMRTILHPAWLALEASHNGAGVEAIKESILLAEIANRIVTYGNKIGITFTTIKDIPHIDRKVFADALGRALFHPETKSVDTKAPKLPPIRKRDFNKALDTLNKEQENDIQAKKDVGDAMRTQVLKDLSKNLFKDDTNASNSLIDHFLRKKG